MDDWGKVVTRYPYENVGMDHLLSREIILKVTTFYSVLRDYTLSFNRLFFWLKKVFEKWIMK